ncbi:MAG: response regulator [Verrucomicrobiota bacterium]
MLVVDDESSIRQTLQLLLRHEGYEVALAADGREALRQLEERSFELVITDFNMPCLRGDELARLIHGLYPTTGIIMLSACAELLRATRANLAGVDVLLDKPFALEQLRDAIQATLARRLVGRIKADAVAGLAKVHNTPAASRAIHASPQCSLGRQ